LTPNKRFEQDAVSYARPSALGVCSSATRWIDPTIGLSVTSGSYPLHYLLTQLDEAGLYFTSTDAVRTPCVTIAVVGERIEGVRELVDRRIRENSE
jgi:hypothetical protein